MTCSRFIGLAALACAAGILPASAGVYLSSYSFTADSLPYIWTNEPLPEPYRLRAKIAGSYHATNLFNNDWTRLESVPGPGTYQVELYWVLYDEDWSTVTEVGPFLTTTLIVQSSLQPPQTHWVSATAASPGQVTTLTGNASDPNGNLQWLHYYINDSDWSGYLPIGSAYVGATSGATASLAWQIPAGNPTGTYQAHLRASDTTGLWDWNGGAVAQFSVRASQPAVTSVHATVAFGSPFSPVLIGGAGTGPWQWVVANKTNWGGSQPGTLLLPNNTVSSTWIVDDPKTQYFYVIRQGDEDYLPSNIAGPFPIFVIVPPPTIASQPQSLAVIAGQPASFAVVASGIGSIAYQWYRNGTPLPGATAPTITIPAAQPADAGTYAVLVGTTGGSVFSHTVTLTVTALPPVIVLGPASQTVNAGQTATFTVAASGGAPLAYQWRKDGGNLPGATAATLIVNDAQPAHSGAYSVVVSNSAGAATSTSAILTVTPAAPTLTAQPASQSVSVGQAASFAVAAAGSSPLSYQWRKNGAAIPGATSSTLLMPSAQTGDAANSPGYTVVVTNSAGSATSLPATLAVSSTPPIRLALQYWQPGDWPNHGLGTGDYDDDWVWVDGHETEVGHEEDTDGDGYNDTWVSDGYEWVAGGWEWQSVWVEDVAPDGLYGSRWDTTTGTFGPPTTTDSGAYLPSAPNRGYLLYSYPTGYTYVVLRLWAYAPGGNCSNFSFALYAPSGNATYLAGGIVSGDYAEIWMPAWIWGSGSYRVDLSYSGATATAHPSGTVSYHIALGIAPPPTIVAHPGPASQTVNAGATVAYSVSASGATTYQWQKDGSALAGATTASLSLVNVTPAATGAYRVIVANATGSTPSDSVALQVAGNAWDDTDGDGLPYSIEQLLSTNPAQAATRDAANTTLQLKIHLP